MTFDLSTYFSEKPSGQERITQMEQDLRASLIRYKEHPHFPDIAEEITLQLGIFVLMGLKNSNALTETSIRNVLKTVHSPQARFQSSENDFPAAPTQSLGPADLRQATTDMLHRYIHSYVNKIHIFSVSMSKDGADRIIMTSGDNCHTEHLQQLSFVFLATLPGAASLSWDDMVILANDALVDAIYCSLENKIEIINPSSTITLPSLTRK